MSELNLDVMGWIGSTYGDDAARATMGSLRIDAGEGLKISITEVKDSLSQSVRSHINVPLVSVAEWLLMNWWRLQWEGRPEKRTTSWYQAHCLAGIGGDDAWPALEIFSDGELIQLRMKAESTADVSSIRYLRSVSLEVPARDFEAAVERLASTVEARLSLLRQTSFAELRSPLRGAAAPAFVSPGTSPGPHGAARRSALPRQVCRSSAILAPLDPIPVPLDSLADSLDPFDDPLDPIADPLDSFLNGVHSFRYALPPP